MEGPCTSKKTLQYRWYSAPELCNIVHFPLIHSLIYLDISGGLLICQSLYMMLGEPGIIPDHFEG